MSNRGSIIYIVDDDVSVRRALTLLLKSYGFKVQEFTRAEEFLEFKSLKSLACLILDIRLPGINGFALQEVMKSRGIFTPIIFITGHGDIPMSVKAMKAGAVDFLSKPITEKKLLNAIIPAILRSKAQSKEQAGISKIKRRIKTLSVRELEVFRLVVKGMLSKQIAFRRGITLQTIKVHRSRVMQKMEAKTVTELIRFAEKCGIISH